MFDVEKNIGVFQLKFYISFFQQHKIYLKLHGIICM